MDTRTHPNQTTPPELVKRNTKILALANAGASLAQISALYDISRERVRQILERERKNGTRAA